MTGPVVAPTRHDRLARWASEVLGGPSGARVGAGRHRGLPWSLPVLVPVAVAVLALGALSKQHCRAEGFVAPGSYVHACYSDVPVLVAAVGPLDQSPPALAALAAVEALAGDGSDRLRTAFDVGVLLSAVALVVLVVAVGALAGRRRWDAALVAASPLVALLVPVSLDLVAVAVAVGGLWAWSRGSPAAAGALLGLAAAWRPPLAAVLAAVLLVGARRGLASGVVRCGLVAAGTWAAAQAPLLLLAPDRWAAPWRSWWGAEPGLGSVWHVLREAGVPLDGATTTALSLATGAAGVAAAVVWVRRCPRPPRTASVALVLLVAVLVASPALPLQASLLVLPLAALAVPRWSWHVGWWLAEVLAFVVTWQFLVAGTTPDRAAPAWLYALAVLVRLGALAALAWGAVRAGRWPALDEVRTRPAAAVATPDGDPAAPYPTGAVDDGRGTPSAAVPWTSTTAGGGRPEGGTGLPR